MLGIWQNLLAQLHCQVLLLTLQTLPLFASDYYRQPPSATLGTALNICVAPHAD
jgi:hypothetical protein